MRTAQAKPCQRTVDGFPTAWGSLCPKSERVRLDACSQGSPGVGKRHAGKYREWTLLRQRGGGGGNATPLPTPGVGISDAPVPTYRCVVFGGRHGLAELAGLRRRCWIPASNRFFAAISSRSTRSMDPICPNSPSTSQERIRTGKSLPCYPVGSRWKAAAHSAKVN